MTKKIFVIFCFFVTYIFLLQISGRTEPTLSVEDRKTWILCIKKVKMQPPCCGACKVMTTQEAKAIWKFLTGSAPRKEQEKNLEIWLVWKERLLEEFKNLSPERYKILYVTPSNKTEDPKND
jgi:hypothetical protein